MVARELHEPSADELFGLSGTKPSASARASPVAADRMHTVEHSSDNQAASNFLPGQVLLHCASAAGCATVHIRICNAEGWVGGMGPGEGRGEGASCQWNASCTAPLREEHLQCLGNVAGWACSCAHPAHAAVPSATYALACLSYNIVLPCLQSQASNLGGSSNARHPAAAAAAAEHAKAGHLGSWQQAPVSTGLLTGQHSSCLTCLTPPSSFKLLQVTRPPGVSCFGSPRVRTSPFVPIFGTSQARPVLPCFHFTSCDWCSRSLAQSGLWFWRRG